MIDAVGIAPPHLINSKFGKSLVDEASDKGIKLTFKEVRADNARDFLTHFASCNNVVTWGYKMPHRWMTRTPKNVLYVENGLFNQRKRAYIDSEGYFSDSSLCRNRHWLECQEADDEALAKEIGLHSQPKPEFDILVALQMPQDGPMKNYFPLADKETDKVSAFLALLKANLPRGLKVLVRPHPRSRNEFDMERVWSKDWELDESPSFPVAMGKAKTLVAVNSTCITEALAVRTPVAYFGLGSFTGSGVGLDCSQRPQQVANLLQFTPDGSLTRRYLSAVIERHSVEYCNSVAGNPEFAAWVARATAKPPFSPQANRH